MKVPEYKDPFPTVDRMNPEQKRFYRFWLSEWQSANAIPLDGQVSYGFCYLYSVLQSPVSTAADVLERMSIAYPDEGVLTLYVRCWLSDCYVTEERYREALEVFPEPNGGRRVSYITDKRLNLKLLAGRHISGREAVAVVGSRLTEFGKRHSEHLAEYLEIQLRILERERGVSLLEEWAGDAYRTRYEIFTGYLGAREIDLPFYHFSTHERVVGEIDFLRREAEKTLREEEGLPGIPEVWAAEAELWYQLKRFFSAEPVVYHSRPSWLERQHLDILLPRRGVAIECQGSKDEFLADFSGGEGAVREGNRRAPEKRALCTAHGIRIVSVSSDYNLDAVIEKIVETARAGNR